MLGSPHALESDAAPPPSPPASRPPNAALWLVSRTFWLLSTLGSARSAAGMAPKRKAAAAAAAEDKLEVPEGPSTSGAEPSKVVYLGCVELRSSGPPCMSLQGAVPHVALLALLPQAHSPRFL